MRCLLGIIFVSAGLIALEIGITRVFSTMIWYHLSFMAVSLALLGFSLGGILLLAFPSLVDRERRSLLPTGALLFGLTVASAILFISAQPQSLRTLQAVTSRGPNAAAVLYFSALLVILVCAFLFSGLTVSAALTRGAADISRLYFANLLGSGLGCLLIIGLLSWLGAFHSLLAVVALAAAGSLCFLRDSRPPEPADSRSRLVADADRSSGSGGLDPGTDTELLRQWPSTRSGEEAPGHCESQRRACPRVPDHAAPGECRRLRPGRSGPISILLNGALLLGVLAAFFYIDRQAVFTHPLFTRRDVTDANRVYRRWNSFSCVDFYKPGPESAISYDGETASVAYEGLWGLSPRYRGKLPQPIKAIIDSWAVTSINKVEADTLDLPLYDYLPTNLAYQVKSEPRVLIMGAGGGIDVLSALHYRASFVRAVEINPAIVEAVETRFADYAGHLYDRPGVEVIVGEGRHWINKDPSLYDLIQLSGVDTLSGAQASSYSFSESYLYTLEAFDEYLRHLEPDGIVTFLRFSFKKPREMLRLFTSAAEALERQGVREPGKHIFVVHSNVLIFANLMVKKSPFTPEEVDRLERVVEEKGFRILYAPYREGDNEFYQFIRSADRAAFYDRYPFRIKPVTDDNPFFFNYTKIKDLVRPPDEKLYWLYWVGQTILFYGLGAVLCLSLPFLFVPLLVYRIRGRVIPGKYRFILYFACLGLGFMFVEILLMQRFTLFLGQPIHALALVLFCLLVFAGLGSLVSRGIEPTRGRNMPLLFGGLLLSLLATYLLTGPVFDSLLKASLPARLAISVALLAPASFLLGFPFPLGVRLAERHARVMVPWGWALNGYASVVGSFLSVILGITFGFTRVYFLALALYAFGATCLVSLTRRFSGSAC
jgi:spermidine synthase